MVPAEQRVVHPAPPVVRALDVLAKSVLVVLLVLVILDPGWGNLEGKAAGARAVGYPLVAFTVPIVWALAWRRRASFPWVPDLLVTLTCFSDTLGNRLDLFDSVWWFDDLMHVLNTGMVTAAFVLLTKRRDAGLGATIERALAFGLSAALAWEIAEYYAFVRLSSERRSAYADTLGDLALGAVGAVLAALVVHALWQRGHLLTSAPQLEEELRQHPAEAPANRGTG